MSDDVPATHALRLAIIGVFCVAIGFTTGFLILDQDQKTTRKAQEDLAAFAANRWQERISQQLFAVLSTAYSLGGFAISAFPSIPPHNSTDKSLRMQTLAPGRFDIFCADMKNTVPGLLSLQLQSSGIISQAYPAGTAPIGLDILNHPTQKGDVYRAIEAKGNVVAGPLDLVQGGLGIIVRYPIFANQTNKTFATWWGNAAVVMRVKEFLADIGIAADMAASRHHFALWFVNASMVTLTMGSSNGSDFGALSASGITRAISLPNGNSWYLAAMPVDGWHESMSAGGIAGTIVGSIGAAMVMVVAIHLARAAVLSNQRSTKNAPEKQPLYLIFTDIESSTAMWADNPEEMPDIISMHNEIIRQVLAGNRGYEVKTVGDCFMIATKHCKDALAIATGIQKAFLATTWPQCVKHFYGDEYLRVRIGVHRCVDVTPTFDEVSKGWDYYGHDVNYSARLESVAVGGEILVSKACLTEAQELKVDYVFNEMGEVLFKGIDELQMVFRLNVTGLVNRRERVDANEATSISENTSMVSSARSSPQISARGGNNNINISSGKSGVYGNVDIIYKLLMENGSLTEKLAIADASDCASQQPTITSTYRLAMISHDAIATLIGPLKSKQKKHMLKELTDRMSIPNDEHVIPRLAVRVAQINERRMGGAALHRDSFCHSGAYSPQGLGSPKESRLSAKSLTPTTSAI
jgi:class 3 adenylate cyclase